MPYSDATFDGEVEEFLRDHPFTRYLDIGPGAGKYGQMIRRVAPAAFIEAVEADASYISQFNLRSIYDKVHHARAETFFDKRPGYTTDIAIIGDAIEHLKKSDGIDLVHQLVYRTQWIVIIFPTKVIQYDWEGHASEAHRSVWTAADFAPFDFRHKKRGYMNFVAVRGYLGDSKAVIVK